jgi:hypothetical protein
LFKGNDMMDGKEERIRERAYQIWEEAGRPQGYQDLHWRQAEQEIAAIDQEASLPPDITGKAAFAPVEQVLAEGEADEPVVQASRFNERPLDDTGEPKER